jgi:rusticyanin
MKNDVFPVFLAVSLLATSVPVASSAAVGSPHSATHPGFSVIRSAPKAVANGALAAAEKSATRGKVSPDKKTLTFTQKAVRLVIRTGPHNDMLSYRIQGLRNPTLALPPGATVWALYVNTDDDMKHNLRFTADKPPFPSRLNGAHSVGTHDLAPMSKAASGEEITLRVPAAKGTYAYLCTVMGHASGGMFGTVVVR